MGKLKIMTYEELMQAFYRQNINFSKEYNMLTGNYYITVYKKYDSENLMIFYSGIFYDLERGLETCYNRLIMQQRTQTIKAVQK